MHLKCPHCQTVLNVTSPAGTQVQCPTCQGMFLVPQMAPSGPAAPSIPSPVITPREPGSKSFSKKKAKEKTPADPNQQAEGAEGEEELEEREIPWDLILKIAYFVVIPLTSTVVLFFVLSAFGVFGPGQPDVVDNSRYNNDGVANSGNQIQEVMEAAEKGDIYVKWIPAKNSATMEGFKVKINHIDWGEVRGRDEQGELVTSNGRPYMNVFLELSNRSDKTFNFKSWYGNTFTTENGSIRTAQLSDDDKNMYYPLKFDDLADLKWWTPKKTFAPFEEGTDSIVFDVPEDFDPSKVENLYLDLPGEAVGLSGSYRFKIPKSMIQGL